MKGIALLLLLPCLLLGCATSARRSGPESGARTVLSPAFRFRPGLRLLVLPFEVTGNPDKTEDPAEADFLGSELAKAGFVIVDSTLFRKHNLQLGGLLADDDPASIRRKLEIALVAQGVVNYGIAGSRGLFGKSYRYLESASVRLVDLASGEDVVIATVRDIWGSPAAALGESIKAALEGRKD